MTEVGLRPVARMWEMTGGDLDDPGLVEDFRAQIASRMGATPGYLGKVVLIDRDRAVLRGLSVWDGDEALESSWSLFAPVAAAMARAASATLAEPRNLEVIHSRFRGVRGRQPKADEVSVMRARVGTLDGGDVTSPWVVDVIRKRLSEAVAQAPGCVAALLFCDRDTSTVLSTSIWADTTSVERTSSFFTEAFSAIAEASRSTMGDGRTYEVLNYQQLG